MNFLKSRKIKENIFLILIFLSLLISSFNIINNFFEKVVFGDRQVFGDFMVYRCGAISFINNINPYEANALSKCFNTLGNSLDYFYPPHPLKIFSFFSNISLSNSIILWALIIIPIFMCQVLMIKRIFFKETNLILVFTIYLFSFGGLNFTGLLTGNITVLMYSLLSISFYYSIIKKNTIPLFIILTLMCLFKITYLVFFILIFLISKKKFFTNTLISLSTIIIFYLFSYFNDPNLFIDFLNHLTYLRSNEFYNLYGGGFGLYSIIKEIPEYYFPELSNTYKIIFQIAWFSVCGLFILSIFYLFIDNKSFSKTHILAIALLIITICYPLIKDYEGFLLVAVIYYLILNINWKFFLQDTKKIKYLLFFLTFSIHDKYMLILISMIIYLSILYLDYKKKKVFINNENF